MEKIVLEMDDRVAKAWSEASTDRKQDIESKINISINKEYLITIRKTS